MDLIEWAFQKISDRKSSIDKKRANDNAINLEDELITINLLISFILEGESQPIYGGKGIGRASLNSIFLPDKLCYFHDSPIKNRNLLIHKALVAGIIVHKKICYSSNQLNYAQKTLEIIYNQDKIIFELENVFPQFKNFSAKVMDDLKELKPVKKVEESQFKNLLKIKQADSFFRWREFPEFALAPWVELLEWQSVKNNNANLNGPSITESEKKAHEGTEVLGQTSTEAPEEVSLEKLKKDQNPVIHSFEKLETLDEYNGGSRVTDAEDDLADHSKALEELNLKHVTREGGGAGSIFKGHFSEFFGGNMFKEPTPRFATYTKVPEWDFKHKKMLQDHCRLYLMTEEINKVNEESGSKYQEELKEKYYLELQNWKAKIASLVNQRQFKDRELDGPEWNIDDYARYLADVKSCGNGDNKIFKQSLRLQRDFKVTILMDVSLSSDSWVANQRVLDIQLDSVGLCGLLLESLNDSISIVSTWSETRHHCYLQTIKNFHSPWSNFFNQAKNISPRGYTRLGPAIRETSLQLSRAETKNRLLILITDGKPTDLDHYEGKYGIEDMRHALLQAEQLGIHVQALAIDKEAKYYFPQIFRSGNYQILSDPKKLPEQLFKIYFDLIH